jgi:hypothetical protein
MIGLADIDELFADSQFVPANGYLDRSAIPVGWTIRLHLVCFYLYLKMILA